ncbi:hypothetical protein KJF94_16150 [Pseudomonas hormoni]|uniref:Uncharacterized protein n=1 Tax=Pseudomonas hormoni TaxID=3093767 RepID=A0ABX8EQA7_9PSED|nr:MULTISPECIES: hypothetical protein [Pseudomonas]QVW21445.1 hypothetical protein KJF94_16150 [Pseudomonas hormoni]
MNAAMTFEKNPRKVRRNADEMEQVRAKKGKRNKTQRGGRTEWEAAE